MTSRDDSNLPPLPEKARFALSAFRAEEPSAYQRARIHAALYAAARKRLSSEGVAKRPARGWYSHGGFWGGVGVALVSAMLLLGLERSGGNATAQAPREALPLREVSFLLPEGGGWVVLPWALDRHPEGRARVHLETPTELDFHQHASHLPAVQLVSCDGDRCLHQFTVDAGDDAEPLRVRIHRPGHYKFHVSHASDARHIAETFIVRAEQ